MAEHLFSYCRYRSWLQNKAGCSICHCDRYQYSPRATGYPPLSTFTDLLDWCGAFFHRMQRSAISPLRDKCAITRSTHRVNVRIPDVLKVVGDVEVTLHDWARRPPACPTENPREPHNTTVSQSLSLRRCNSGKNVNYTPVGWHTVIISRNTVHHHKFKFHYQWPFVFAIK